MVASDGTVNLRWTDEADARLDRIPSGPMRAMATRVIATLAEQACLEVITLEYVEQVLAIIRHGSEAVSETLSWDDEARQGIARAPDMVRGMLIREIEQLAREQGLQRVDAAIVEQAKERWQRGGVFHLDPSDPRSRS
ncbi:PCP reductase family protein [Aestuariirhabdus sp. LZHN29]|uniref:PCP reductase family protein n=1 Tax=Aestuariirhabdus sp. LZHN29 TaxID=3417462 RepID=UPI003CEFC54B